MSSRNPFDDLERMIDRMTQQFEGFEPLSGGVPVDVVDLGDEFEVTADLPGYERDDIEVELSETTVRIGADSEDEREVESGEYLRRERTTRASSRSVRLPERVDEEGTSATYEAGVLRITLPKLAASEEGTDIPIE